MHSYTLCYIFVVDKITKPKTGIMKKLEIKAQADRIRLLSDIPKNTLLGRIATATIKEVGYYTYVDGTTKEKIFVE